MIPKRSYGLYGDSTNRPRDCVCNVQWVTNSGSFYLQLFYIPKRISGSRANLEPGRNIAMCCEILVWVTAAIPVNHHRPASIASLRICCNSTVCFVACLAGIAGSSVVWIPTTTLGLMSYLRSALRRGTHLRRAHALPTLLHQLNPTAHLFRFSWLEPDRSIAEPREISTSRSHGVASLAVYGS